MAAQGNKGKLGLQEHQPLLSASDLIDDPGESKGDTMLKGILLRA